MSNIDKGPKQQHSIHHNISPNENDNNTLSDKLRKKR